MNMQIRPIMRTANAIGLAAIALPSAAAAVSNHNPNGWERVAVQGCEGSSRNSLLNSMRQGARGVTATQRVTHERLRQQFAELKALPDQWDGDGSISPDETAIARASSILEYALKGLDFVADPVIVPVADGSVQAEWYSPSHRFEMYFEVDGTVSAWSEDRKNAVEYDADGRDAVQMLVQWAAMMNDEHLYSVI